MNDVDAVIKRQKSVLRQAKRQIRRSCNVVRRRASPAKSLYSGVYDEIYESPLSLDGDNAADRRDRPTPLEVAVITRLILNGGESCIYQALMTGDTSS